MRPLTFTLTVLLAGCFDFEPVEEVVDLRVLGIAAEPPEVMVVAAPAGGSGPAGNVYTISEDPPPVAMTALVVNPRNPEPLTYEITACVWSSTYRCAEWSATERMPVASGTAEPGEIEFDFAPSAQRLNEWLALDPYRGFGGLYVMLELRIEQPGEAVNHASKLVTYNVPFVPRASDQDPPPPKLPNQNPRLTALKIDELPTLDETPVELAAGADAVLEPIFNEDAAIETYPVVRIPSDAKPELGYVLLTEKLEFEFYVTDGALSRFELQSRDPRGDPVELESTFTAPKEGGSVTLWVVMRDDRGGASWVRRVLAVSEP